ncbi:hypothetical protein PHLGIDRAFT_117491 [Phlebiopsis gigantea 11061_1 CR5-6]|uniref:Uncharacterized protein n=1 Tax=Phlebiopsis gigantea (strain 11061_1 CR5-6) TaxID=745531 RepID=A0A0C3S045_PHLG1|nr:hypothetical protein PHLGIDRAFT_117491 [Phlebiopsis gigantea 11061_1 CR5-6]
MSTAQDKAWKDRGQGEEAQYVHAKEQEQLATIRDKLQHPDKAVAVDTSKPAETAPARPRDEFEGGFGGQEDLEDRYATTLGEH